MQKPLDSARVLLDIQERQPFSFLTETTELAEAYALGRAGDGITFGWDMIDGNTENFRKVAHEVASKGFRIKVYISFSHTEVHSDYDTMDSFDVDTIITNEPFLLKSYYERSSIRGF